MAENGSEPRGLIARLVSPFLAGKPAILFLILAFCMGAAAIMVTPREEDPQIVVPLADIFVQAPGASPQEVEMLVATPLERLLWQIDGVEYVYSMSREGMAVVTVRFFVGEDREASLVKLHNKIRMNIDIVPPIVQGWVIKPVEIDDVPIVNLTLYSDRYSDHELRRMGEEVLWRLSDLANISRTAIVGGRQREVRVEFLPERMAAMGVSTLDIRQVLQGADVSATAGRRVRFNRSVRVTSNAFLTTAREVAALVVGVHDGRPVYLRDIARIHDGPAEADQYTRVGFGSYFLKRRGQPEKAAGYPAVTLALAKKRGTNAVDVAENVLARMETLQKELIPDGVEVIVTRNYGETAQEKVNDLLASLGFAIATVVLLLVFALGWREALVVAVAVPVSFSLALFANYLFGYTINRVTLFALILSLGLVVDDPITNVDNIQRHIFMGKRRPREATLFAVSEVLPPVIMSTLAIIVSFTPLFFITGMMGPYMAPMAANVPLTVTFSTLCALSVVPWLSYRLLKHAPAAPAGGGSLENVPAGLSRAYRALVTPFLESRPKRYLLLGLILVLLAVSVSLALFRQVPLKMLPFDNKNEFQLVIDLPEGSTLEATDQVVRAFEDYLRQVNEVTNFVSYVGTASPMDFNGLVRHYYLREGEHLADIRVNLAHKSVRAQQSHGIVLRLRRDLMAIADAQGARLKMVEVPPGPPVLATLVAEIYGAPGNRYEDLIRSARQVSRLMAEEPNVVDVDIMTEAERERINVVVDREKAALHGVSTQVITRTLQIALGGDAPATLHKPDERQPLPVRMILPREKRSNLADLLQLPVTTASGEQVPLAELVEVREMPEEQTIYHKNLDRVVYVLGEMAGRAPAEAILDLQSRLAADPLPDGIRAQWAGEGEWKITLRVFRDMGIAFAAAMVGIYLLMIVQTNSFLMPVLIMMAIPLTLLGIMPGFWLLNLVAGGSVGGYDSLVFFTATSMIGMIALGGIVIRNSLVLIEFIQDSIQEGMPVKEAILQSGVIRMRPILLTAATTALGAWPITLDPIFSGLAWALIFGLVASTLFTLLVVPVTYFAFYGQGRPAD